jgi:hypothetical protein
MDELARVSANLRVAASFNSDWLVDFYMRPDVLSYDPNIRDIKIHGVQGISQPSSSSIDKASCISFDFIVLCPIDKFLYRPLSLPCSHSNNLYGLVIIIVAHGRAFT